MPASFGERNPTTLSNMARAIDSEGFARTLVALVADASNAAGWESQPALSDSVVVESLGPPALLPGATGARVLYSPTLSADCAPPRGCYAKSQRIHYDFSCAPRYAVVTERISMDLNGAIIKHEVRGAASRYVPEYDAGVFGCSNVRREDLVMPLQVAE